MKNLSRICFLFLCVAVMSVALSSCGKDSCYECLGFDDGTTSLEDLGTICVGDDDGSGGSVTEEALEQAVAAYELFGGNCTKK